MEHIESYKENEVPDRKNLEESIDHEGLDTSAMLDRASHPKIKQQIIDFLWKAEEQKRGKIEHEVQYGPDGKALRDGKKFVTKQHVFVPRTREEIEREVNKKIERMGRQTTISFTDRQPGASANSEIIPLNWKNPMTGEKPTTRVMSIIEAHEKGHVLRWYRDKESNAMFSGSVDSAAVSTLFTEEYYQMLYSEYNKNHPKNVVDFELAKELYFSYLFSAAEMSERMSQLKNYFSMHGDESFTREHLSYARKHYVTDTGLDNGMTFLFQAITPEKEESFLSLMNSAGI